MERAGVVLDEVVVAELVGAGVLADASRLAGHAAVLSKYAMAARSHSTVMYGRSAALSLKHRSPRGAEVRWSWSRWRRRPPGFCTAPQMPHASDPLISTYASYGSSKALRWLGRFRAGLGRPHSAHLRV